MRWRTLQIGLVTLFTLTLQTIGQPANAQGTPTVSTGETICAQFEGTPVASETEQPAADVDLANLDFDLIFIDAMIPHHQAGIQLATIVLERSERQQLLDLAQVMIDTQTVEITLMGSWRNEWYSDAPQLTELQLADAMNMKLAESPGVGGVAGLEEMGAEHMNEDVRALCGAGDDLDRLFIDTVLAHNSAAIILAREAINRANHREIKNLGDAIAVQQQTEIDQVLTWREIWFAGTPIPDHHDG